MEENITTTILNSKAHELRKYLHSTNPIIGHVLSLLELIERPKKLPALTTDQKTSSKINEAGTKNKSSAEKSPIKS